MLPKLDLIKLIFQDSMSLEFKEIIFNNENVPSSILTNDLSNVLKQYTGKRSISQLTMISTDLKNRNAKDLLTSELFIYYSMLITDDLIIVDESLLTEYLFDFIVDNKKSSVFKGANVIDIIFELYAKTQLQSTSALKVIFNDAHFIHNADIDKKLLIQNIRKYFDHLKKSPIFEKQINQLAYNRFDDPEITRDLIHIARSSGKDSIIPIMLRNNPNVTVEHLFSSPDNGFCNIRYPIGVKIVENDKNSINSHIYHSILTAITFANEQDPQKRSVEFFNYLNTMRKNDDIKINDNLSIE